MTRGMVQKRSSTCFSELHRPQFHFTPQVDWMNDPNGLVFYKGEYHLFFQHTPGSLRHGPNTWGHAISRDLVHWQQIDHALEPGEYGWIWSGSAVVDWNNTAGLRKGDEATVVAIYTTGGFGDPSHRCVQAIAYSNDRGRTFTKYEDNPVLGHIRANNRDPKVIWHEPTQKWVMALFLDQNDFALFGSDDLKYWQHLCNVEIAGTSECPDIFELPVDGDLGDKKWVFWGGAGVYRIGTFDGLTFVPETGSPRAELGTNGYAAQTWSDIPAVDGRRIQISWMRGGKYPAMPFNQQMSFPVELTLRTTPEGIRLFREPVREIELLHGRKHEWREHLLAAGPSRRELFCLYGPTWRDRLPELYTNLVPDTGWDLFDIRAEIDLGSAQAFGVFIRGMDLRYDVAGARFTFLGCEIPVTCDDERLRLQILVDRTSLELFADDGRASASFCFLPEACDDRLEFYAVDGSVKVVSLVVHELESAWRDR